MKRKFRIWDIETKQFFYWSISENSPTCLTKEYIEKSSQQFTGLHDKNGKEIWEGDVLQFQNTSAEWYRRIVIFLNGYFGYKDETGQAYPISIKIGNSSGSSKKWEVIGNIYSNPELLEKGE